MSTCKLTVLASVARCRACISARRRSPECRIDKRISGSNEDGWRVFQPRPNRYGAGWESGRLRLLPVSGSFDRGIGLNDPATPSVYRDPSLRSVFACMVDQKCVELTTFFRCFWCFLCQRKSCAKQTETRFDSTEHAIANDFYSKITICLANVFRAKILRDNTVCDTSNAVIK